MCTLHIWHHAWITQLIAATATASVSHSCVNGSVGSTFDSMHGLGGALRLFVAALWLESSVLQGNTGQAIAGAFFFNLSCLQVCLPMCSLCSACQEFQVKRLKQASRVVCIAFVCLCTAVQEYSMLGTNYLAEVCG